jgi:hypothetical protein
MSDQKPAKPIIDWEAVELHYRAGIRSLKDMGAEYGVSDAGILKRAKRDGWTRNLKAKIQAKAEAKVSAAAVSAQVSEQKAANETQVIEANADLQYRIRLEHRSDIGRTRSLFRALLGEIEAETDHLALFQALGELLDTSGPDQTGTWRQDKLNDLYKKVISATGRIDGAKKLTEMLEKLVKLERQAFGIEDGESEKSGVEDLLKRIGEKALNG